MAEQQYKQYPNGTGRRKKCVARAFLREGKGAVTVNGKDYKEYFTTDTMRAAVVRPLDVLNKVGTVNFEISVHGGGLSGQADAVALGMARAFLAEDESLRKVLRDNGLLTVDSRVKERKKYGQKAARRRFQFVKR